MSAAKEKASARTTQDVCIDLPGETVQCWRSSENIKVILRKHRDIIFDLHLGKGKTYTVEATSSDFYNARDKKLVYAKRRQVVTFSDGERLHLWVTRTFQGALILRSGGKVLMKVEPNELDKHQYDDAPKTKPAPIIVALGAKDNAKTLPASLGTNKSLTSTVIATVPSSAPTEEQLSLVCVVEGTIKGMPNIFAEHFKKGGGKSGFADIDPNEVATRNWIWGQVAGGGAYVADNWKWLRASLDSKTHTGFRLVSAKVHMVRGKVRFYFSGFSKYNAVFGSGGFGPAHDRIMSIFAGVGKTSSSFAAMAKGVAGTFKGNALVSLIFGAATAIAEWQDDAQKDGYDLAAALFTAVVKAIIVAVWVAVIVAIFVALAMVNGTFAVPVIALGIITVIGSFTANYIVEATDKKLGLAFGGDSKSTDGTAAPIATAMRHAEAATKQIWQELMKKFPVDYQEVVF